MFLPPKTQPGHKTIKELQNKAYLKCNPCSCLVKKVLIEKKLNRIFPSVSVMWPDSIQYSSLFLSHCACLSCKYWICTKAQKNRHTQPFLLIFTHTGNLASPINLHVFGLQEETLLGQKTEKECSSLAGSDLEPYIVDTTRRRTATLPLRNPVKPFVSFCRLLVR